MSGTPHVLLTLCLGVSAAALAAGDLRAQDATGATPMTVDVSGGSTVVAQSTNDDRVQNEVVASFDLFLTVGNERVRLESYVEANTTPRLNGVSRWIGEANTDAGTALNRRRRGRVQLSEVRLVVPFAALEAHVGLLDATGFLDVSRIANDENRFFLAVPFVNNPTINFPDYALGGAVTGPLSEDGRVEISGVLTSSNGLADNPNVSYAQLLRVTEDGKGVFAGATVRWEGEGRRFALGGWLNTADKERLDGTPGPEDGGGVFGVAGWFRGPHSVNVRAGLADGSVSMARGFTGVSWVWDEAPHAVGLAVGRSFASSHVPGAEDVSLGELFLRRRIVRGVTVSASLQRIANSGFDGSGMTYAAALWVPGVRLAAQF